MNERALTELSVTEAENASVRAVDDGSDNVTQHRSGNIALARHLTIKKKRETKCRRVIIMV
jgi:hypothetical protein